jgi:ATP-dependent DNA helicase RecG
VALGNTLFSPLEDIKGVGEATCRHLQKILPSFDATASSRVLFRDLLLHIPVNLKDRRALTQVKDAQEGIEQVFHLRVLKHTPPPNGALAKRRRIPYRILTEDETGSLLLTYFYANGQYLTRTLPVSEMRYVAGVVSFYDGKATIAHPSQVAIEAHQHLLRRIHPVYPASQKISSKLISKTIGQVLARDIRITEWVDQKRLKPLHWPGFLQALKAIHLPENMDALAFDAPHRVRLAYDELLAHQLMLQRLRAQSMHTNAHVIRPNNGWLTDALHKLAFKLTADQASVLHDILQDLGTHNPMARLLQGDVGCGKTIIAFLAMAAVAKAGKQALLMAPTDLLARQHMAQLKDLAADFGLSMMLLTGKLTAAEKREAITAIACGDCDIAIGTHALFQQAVSFDNLALAVIDEQHRFGVNQRKQLLEKAKNPHILHMSATPIPRSLSMTLYGDLDVSTIKQRPPGRQPIDTRTIPISRVDEVIANMQRVIDRNERIYWVCPLITPSEEENNDKQKLAAAEERFAVLNKIFPNKVGIIHGQMPVKQREKAMQAFVSGEIAVLVATTVIEVGVNVPEASVMVIEQAERFGLAQLHQLRGRVGRSNLASSCVLLYGKNPGETAKQRLKILRETNDGFVLAEEDLRLRGAGDVLGTKQTGLPEFIFANLFQDQQILRMAREDAQEILKESPALKSSQAIADLLQIFGYTARNTQAHTA